MKVVSNQARNTTVNKQLPQPGVPNANNVFGPVVRLTNSNHISGFRAEVGSTLKWVLENANPGVLGVLGRRNHPFHLMILI